jgi:hypothetical protein
LDAIVREIEIHHNIVRLGAGIITLQSRDIDIHDNIIEGPGKGGGNRWGIRLGCALGSNTSVAQLDVEIHDNIIDGDADTGAGITIEANGGRVQEIRVYDNLIRDVARSGGVGIYIDGGHVTSPDHTTEIDISHNEILRPNGTAIDWANLVSTAVLRIRSNSGYNPVGNITTPFENIVHTFGVPAGGNAKPVANQDYGCIGLDCVLDITDGAGVSVTLKDPSGIQIAAIGGAPVHALYVPMGYRVNFGNFTAAPTVVVSGN